MKQRIAVLFFALLPASLLFAQDKTATNYEEAGIELKTAKGSVFGSLMLPKGVTNPPVVLIIAGSGPTDRNGNALQMGLNTDAYKKIARQLAANNIASLRYDKRGIGESSNPNFAEADVRFDDFVSDAAGWLKLLHEKKMFSQLIVAGHSEGSLIGMLVAKDADKYISIAGIAQSAADILKKQLNQAPEQVKEALFSKIDSLKNGHTVTDIPGTFNLLRVSVQPYLISWFKYVPTEVIADLKKPTLILQGTKDIQVGTEEATRLAGAKKEAVLLILENMNHTLVKIESDTTNPQLPYADPSLPLHPGLIPAMVKFITGKDVK